MIFYNLLLLLVTILVAPIHCIRLCLGKKYRENTLPRLGFQKFPHWSKEEPSVWIHSVSVGETQVAQTLAAEIKKQNPKVKVAISTVTETGQAVARKIEAADFTFYYPLDFSWLVKKIFRQLQPSKLIVVETDAWISMLNQAKKNSVPAYLVNGKLSETSAKRYKQFPISERLLIKPFEHFFVQTEIYQQRFEKSGVSKDKISLAGNIKLDNSVPQLSDSEKSDLAQKLKISLDKPIIIFGSTHAGEEELCLEVTKELWQDRPDLQCLLVPRHPERFDGIAEMLKKEKLIFNRSSEIHEEMPSENFLLIDEMGLLMKLYAICDIAIVAGSFTPDIGGHNILEPSFYGKAMLYGPWIYKQPGFHQMNLEFEAGIQCQPEDLHREISFLLDSPDKCRELGENGLKAIESSKGCTAQVVKEIYGTEV